MRLLVLLFICGTCDAWNTEDLALYDLAEEVGRNFYEVYGIAQDATLGEIKKAYRKLTLEWHPDKNSAENAAEKFRQIVGIYEVLKDDAMREKYNNVLEFGLPDWRSGVFYYRRYRKMGGAEAMVLLFLIVTATHYLMLWGAYFEKYLVENQRRVKAKRGEKKTLKEAEEEQALRKEEVLKQHRPTWRNIFPIVMCQFTVWFLSELLLLAKQQMEAKREPVEDSEGAAPQPRRWMGSGKKREERVAETAQVSAVVAEVPLDLLPSSDEQRNNRDGVWSGAEMAELIRLSTTKFPPGSSLRWQQIARAMGRTVDDVTAAARRIKHSQATEELAARQGIRVDKTIDRTGEWSQHEQKQLEQALVTYPKGTPERWDRIADAVPGRSKGECVQRFKQLAEIVRSRKEKTGP